MITWKTECDAPCIGMIVDDETGKTHLIQDAWAYPGAASTFGWSVRDVQDGAKCCEHDGTDGTVGCSECRVGSQQFIASAAEYLQSHDGATAADPGYFQEA